MSTLLENLMSLLFDKKIPCKRYFDETSLELELPKLNAEIKGLEISSELTSKLGTYKKISKVNVPTGSSAELVQLDILQMQLAVTINVLKGDIRQEKLIQYCDILFKMISIVSEPKKKVDKEEESQISSMSSELKKFLDERHFKSTLLPDDLNKDQGFIIWPVTLLSKTTFIHKAQAKLIKLLVNSGWKLIVIIGDCGKNLTWRETFSDEVKKILISNDIIIEANTVAYLSDYYQQNDKTINTKLIGGVTGTKILNTFHTVSENLIWDNFDNLIKKNYDEEKKQDIQKRTVLNNIQPLLFWALVATIVKENKLKAILIAGEDEHEQWDYITNKFTSNKLGVIYIHELKKEEDKTMDQEDLKMRNPQEMKEKLEVGNMAKWLFTHFVELPKFKTINKPAFCRISSTECEKFNNNCLECLFDSGNNLNHEHFNKQEFVDYIWPLSNPAN